MDDIERAYDTIAPINPQLASFNVPPPIPRLRATSTSGHHDAAREVSRPRHRPVDHENGIAMAVAAYVLGARMVEKHFTLNHTWKGTDQAFSLEPIGMRKLVRDLRGSRRARDGVKCPLPSEVGPLRQDGKETRCLAGRPAPATCFRPTTSR